jgi:hypothetical protein
VITAYEHVSDRTYGDCLESPKVFDSEKILCIPSAMDDMTPKFAVGAWNLVTYVGFNIYVCHMSHTSKGGL